MSLMNYVKTNPHNYTRTYIMRTFLMVCLCLASCEKRDSLNSILNQPVNCGSQQIDGTQVQYVVLEGKPALTVWVDFVGSERSTCGLGPENSSVGEMIAGGNNRVEWQWNNSSQRQKIVAINGIQFVYAKGTVFLVSMKRDRIQQLQRELSGDASVFTDLRKNDPEVQQFVNNASTP